MIVSYGGEVKHRKKSREHLENTENYTNTKTGKMGNSCQ